MSYKIYTLIIAVILSIKSFSQTTTDTVLMQFYNGSSWDNYYATIINYNDVCLVTESSDYYHNGNRWDTLGRNLYVYNTDGWLTELTRQRWSTSKYTPGWQNEYRNLYYYSNDRLADTMVWQDWAFSNNGYYWRDNYRQIHQYNAQGLEIYMEYNYYDESQQVWVLRDRTYNTYDSYNRTLSTLSQVRNNNNWVNSYKTQTIYQGDSALNYIYIWSTTTNEWNKTGRTYYDLLGYTGKIETGISQSLNGGVWVNSLKEINKFNTDSLNTSNRYQFWDGQQWINSSRTKTSYYSDGVVKRLIVAYWNANTNLWDTDDRILYTNHGCAVSAELVPLNKDEKMQPATRKGNSYSYVFDNGVAGDKHNFKFILTTGRQKNKIISTAKPSAVAASSNSINIFPNPAKNYFMVDVKEKDAGNSFITITNLSGKQVLQQPLKTGIQKINVAPLQKGFYVVSITTNGLVKNHKLLLE